MEKDLRYWLQDADQNGYAIPAFNFNDCWDLMAIVRAAEKEHAPIMVSSVGYVVDSLGLEKKVHRRQNTGCCGSPADAPTQGSG